MGQYWDVSVNGTRSILFPRGYIFLEKKKFDDQVTFGKSDVICAGRIHNEKELTTGAVILTKYLEELGR